MSTIDPHVGEWLNTAECQPPVVRPGYVAHPRLSCRARFDLAGLLTAGLASTVFFLTPLWISVTSSGDVRIAHAPLLDPAAATAAIDASPVTSVAAVAVPAPRSARTRPVLRSTRATKTPEAISVKSDAKPAQSRVARLLLGDGTERVLPFPLANQRSER